MSGWSSLLAWFNGLLYNFVKLSCSRARGTPKSQNQVGNGHCDKCDNEDYNTLECGWDGGNCVLSDRIIEEQRKRSFLIYNL